MGFRYTGGEVKGIVREGFDPIYGARPLRRAIQKYIENPISTLIIEKKVKAGDQIVIDYDGENFIFNIEKTELVTKEGLEKNLPAGRQVKNFFCEACGNHFKTEVVKNSTPMCSKCASAKIQEVVEGNEKLSQNGIANKMPDENKGMNGVSQSQPNLQQAHV